MNSSIDAPARLLIANSNVEAHAIAIQLRNAGINAAVIEDNSLAGYFALGMLDNLHRPQVIVDCSQLEQARAFIQEDSSHPVEAYCYHCGSPVAYAGRESVRCTACGGDVEQEVTPSGTANNQARQLGNARARFFQIRKLFAIVGLAFGLALLVGCAYGVLLIVWEVLKVIGHSATGLYKWYFMLD